MLHAAFQHADMDSLVTGSLAPGPGEFPSISDLDQSLCLPSFPSHAGQGGGGGTMPSIGEELEVSEWMIGKYMQQITWKSPSWTTIWLGSYKIFGIAIANNVV
jgi:hypothetical protein